MKKAILSLAILAAAAAEAVTAAFTYQGVLTDAAGAPLTGNKRVEIRLYNTATGGTDKALWGRTFAVLLSSTEPKGLFNVEVSDADGSQIAGTPATTLAKVFAEQKNATLYIGLKVEGSSGEIAPRQKLLAVPYATVASDVSAASGDFTVSGTLTAANATVSGTLTAKSVAASGALGASSLTTSGNATVGGNLTVNGSITGNGAVPVGGIIMWSGAANSIPANYAICNGSNGTPDLRNRFIVGAGSGYNVGNTGGEQSVTLDVSQLPSHSHWYVGDDQLTKIDGDWSAAVRNTSYNYDAYSTTSGGRGNVYNTSYVGNGKPHENRPPYYALFFIMRIK